MKTLLFIDTSDNTHVTVGLEIDGKKDIVHQVMDRKKAQVVLPLVLQLLQKHKVTLHDITAIAVNPGPGSFTGVRVGVTIANTLGYLLHIPINHNPVGIFVEPVY